MYLYVHEGVCNDPTSTLSSEYQTYSSGTGAPAYPYENVTVSVVCVAGYTFVDGSKTSTITCSSTGTWSFAQTCKCTLNL